MGANLSPLFIREAFCPDRMNMRRVSQTQRAIRRIRERLGFSRVAFAQWPGLSARSVVHWETGNVKPTRMTRRLIFDLLREKIGVRPNPLLAWKE